MILRRAAELLKQQHILRAPKSVADGVALSRNLALVFSFSPALGASAPQQEIMFNGQMDLIAMAQLGEQRAVGAHP